jgi:peptide chain release factor 1
MFDRLNELEAKFSELSEAISDPAVIADTNRFRELMKEHSDLTPIMDAYREYKRLVSLVEDAKILLNEESDEELRQLAKEEIKDSTDALEKVGEELKIRYQKTRTTKKML